MLLTLTASCLKGMLLPGPRSKKAKLDVLDLPNYTKDTLGLSGFNLSTDLLVGSTRARLEAIRERADRASCSCLLLIEPDPQNFGSKDEKLVLAAAQRMTNVVDAAHILGCSAASLKVEAVDDDDTLARVAKALKPIMERAEKVDINLVLAPHKGLTTKPERVTELLKKVGGFRIGTYPDFETAFETSGKKSDGAVSYLHRLTPYASAVCASTTGFGISPGKGKNATEVINPENMGDPKNASHVAYELRPLLEAVLSVGYDGPLALDYRGPGDVAAGLALSRSTILSALGADEDDDDDLDDLMDELEAEDAPDAEESEP
jgi:hypothetical protein